MIIPYKLDQPYARLPISNFIIIIINFIFFLIIHCGFWGQDLFEELVLNEYIFTDLIGSSFLHGDFFHLFFNMFYLWVFGNFICSIVGNALYPVIYVFLACFSSLIHLVMDGSPAIGASGVVYGILGLCIVFAPESRVKVFYFIIIVFFIRAGSFFISSVWLVLLKFFLDISGIFFGGGNIAHFAHLGGLLGGFITGFIILTFKISEPYSKTILDLVSTKNDRRRF